MQRFTYPLFPFVSVSFDCAGYNLSESVSKCLGQPVSEVGEKVAYVNKERDKGTVNVPVPTDFKDLSKEHKPLGCLCGEIKVKA